MYDPTDNICGIKILGIFSLVLLDKFVVNSVYFYKQESFIFRNKRFSKLTGRDFTEIS